MILRPYGEGKYPKQLWIIQGQMTLGDLFYMNLFKDESLIEFLFARNKYRGRLLKWIR